ncbi:MAG TPA: FAD-dependent oxidoreductase, partial [Planctomycetaceae bacterium]|nr:FAD-dependent oxidoreductase [Planctomycetaceae bacterium]
MTQRWQVVILGGGFAGLACARVLEREFGREAHHRLLLVSAENYVTFYPLLPDVVGASLEPEHVIHPLRHVLRHCQVRRAEVSHIDLTRRVVEFDDSELVDHEPVEYEQLVLAFGSGNDMHVVPGMMEHAQFVRTLADAIELRGHIIRKLEEANVESDSERRRKLLHFVVVGGGFSGVEVAGQMLDLLESALKFYPDLQREPPRVTLVHSQEHLLPELDTDLGDRAQRSLERRGLVVMLKTRVLSIGSESVEIGDGQRLSAMNVICTIGSTPHPVLAKLEVEKVKGRVATDPLLRLPGFPNVWAVGDGAVCPDGLGGICPPTGQYATRLGQHAGRNVIATLRGRELQPFRHKSVG